MRQKFFESIFIVLVSFISSFMDGAIPAQEFTAIVDAKMNIFASGRDSTDQCGGGLLPVQINLPTGEERRLKFSTVGNNLSCCNGINAHDADGFYYINIGTYILFSSGSLSGIKHYTRDIFLTGVFLDDSYPSGQAPPMISYYSPLDQSQQPVGAISDQTDEFCPALRQVFFIGDGMAGIGEFQVFHAPDNATRLYLGIADAWNFGWPGGGQPGYYFDNTGSISVTVTSESGSITVSSPNGGETWDVGSSHAITWTTAGTVGNVKIEYSTNNGSSWTIITSPTANDGSYTWTVPNTVSSQCKVKISEAATGIPLDASDNTFSIISGPTITVTSPNGGESWGIGSSHSIKWTTTGIVRNVKIEYTINNSASWTMITPYSPNTGSYTWTVPNTASSQCKIKVSEYHHGIPSDNSDAVFSITAAPTIRLSRIKLNFCSLTSGVATAPQGVSITNNGSGNLHWNISVDAPWLICAPGAGAGNGTIFVSINSTGLTLGTYTGKVIISDPNATNSPQAVSVTLKVKSVSQYTGPFGEFLTPVDGSTVRSSIPVTGWALDDIGIQSVKIYREDGDALALIGDVAFVEGARPDIEAAYPDYPFNYKAGWGYILLTNFLPNGGNGVFKLHAVAASAEGKTADLGVKTITVDNDHAVKPFGAIDTPTQGGTASGGSFVNWGWVLTPQPNSIPTNGSTIGVWIDGVYIGHPVYNNYRQDIASLFPGYANSNGAAGYYYLNTTPYKNGIHTIQWTATDSAGNADGIGSRYFTVQNSGSLRVQPTAEGVENIADIIDAIPTQFSEPITFSRDFRNKDESAELLPDEKGLSRIVIKELEWVEIKLGENDSAIQGYLISNDEYNNLPIGSTLDAKTGTFSWSPGPGFLGRYSLVFVLTDSKGQSFKKSIEIEIEPKFN